MRGNQSKPEHMSARVRRRSCCIFCERQPGGRRVRQSAQTRKCVRPGAAARAVCTGTARVCAQVADVQRSVGLEQFAAVLNGLLHLDEEETERSLPLDRDERTLHVRLRSPLCWRVLCLRTLHVCAVANECVCPWGPRRRCSCCC